LSHNSNTGDAHFLIQTVHLWNLCGFCLAYTLIFSGKISSPLGVIFADFVYNLSYGGLLDLGRKAEVKKNIPNSSLMLSSVMKTSVCAEIKKM